MKLSDNIKPMALIFFIGLASLLHTHPAQAAQTETLTVAGGCFWCVEADFEAVAGVTGVVSGFMGGTVENPTYKQVVNDNTGHYETAVITFEPAKISRATLVAMFLRSIDPTDAGGQFCDRGDNYRSAIFVSDAGEKAMAQQELAKAQSALGQKVVTPILPATKFYPADAYHQDYYKNKRLIVTRFGPKRKSEAYKRYREACGRDARVRQLWGSAAPFAGG